MLGVSVAISACANEHATVTPAQKSALADYVASEKFAATADYAGFQSHDVVKNPDAVLNELARQVALDGSFDREQIIDKAADTLSLFKFADTEDRDRAFEATEKLLSILDIRVPDDRLEQALRP